MSIPYQSRSGPQLLAAASAGLLAQNTLAATYDDTASDLSNNSAAPTPLSILNYDGVNGQIFGTSVGAATDALSLQDLLAGSSLVVNANWTRQGADGTFQIQFRDSAGLSLPGTSDIGPTLPDGSDSRNITVPADGIVRMITLAPGIEHAGWTYTLGFNGTSAAVPESTPLAGAAAVSLAALLAARRRRHGGNSTA